MTSLSSHFRLEEMERNSHGVWNQAGQLEVFALEALCQAVLEPIREKFGPVTITSGFRCKKLNELVGGAPNSKHLKGEAADIKVPGAQLDDVWSWVASNESGIKFDQLIAERLSSSDGTAGWLHISYNSDHNRLNAISSPKKGIYLPGLIYAS